LWDALSRAAAPNRHSAARLVLVGAVDESASSLYRHFAFEPMPERDHRLVQKMSSIESALGG
jgi:hypothetical protein